MSFINRTINKAVLWKTVDVSVREMADIVKTEIIEKSSEDELKQLEDGMLKSWVLRVSGGDNVRYYPSSNSEVQVQVVYSHFTRTVIAISVLDTKTHTAYFISKGKGNCDKFRRAVLRRISQFKGEEDVFYGQAPKTSIWQIIRSVLSTLAFLVVMLLLDKAGFFNSSLPRNKNISVTEPISIVSLAGEEADSGEAGVLSGFAQDGASSRQQETETTFTPYTANEMLQDLKQNALRAEKKYQDQNLEISGFISTFDSDGEYICIAGDSFVTFSPIQCHITDRSQLDMLLNLNIGDPVTIQGNVFSIGEIIGYQVDIAKVIPGEVVRPTEPPKPVETQPPLPTDSYVEPSYGSVRRSTVEIRIRSGPSTSYADIGRLKGGTQVTIYEQQQEASGRWWGRMDDGWVCMDYIVFGEDTSVAPDYEMSTPRNKMSDYSGRWSDTVSMRCMMNITQGNDYLYISIKWGSSASSTTCWEFMGEFDASEGAVYYNNGVCIEYQTIEDGTQIQTTRYTNGEGVLVIQEGYLYWLDGTEGVGDRCIFERQ